MGIRITDNEFVYLGNTESFSICKYQKVNTIKFGNSGSLLIDNENNTMSFDGNVTESAKIFFDEVIKAYIKHLDFQPSR